MDSTQIAQYKWGSTLTRPETPRKRLTAPGWASLKVIAQSGCDVLMESRVPEPVLNELRSKGHQIQLQDAYSQWMGRGNAVMTDSRGIKYGASDPRADGEAIPEHPMYWKSNIQ